jgi:hypothetical protein
LKYVAFKMARLHLKKSQLFTSANFKLSFFNTFGYLLINRPNINFTPQINYLFKNIHNSVTFLEERWNRCNNCSSLLRR